MVSYILILSVGCVNIRKEEVIFTFLLNSQHHALFGSLAVITTIKLRQRAVKTVGLKILEATHNQIRPQVNSPFSLHQGLM